VLQDSIGITSGTTKLAYLLLSSYDDEVDDLDQDLAKFSEIFNANAEFQSIITSDDMRDSVRYDKLVDLLKTVTISSTFDNWLSFVAKSQYLTFLPEILEEVPKVENALETQSTNARIVTAKTMPESEINQLLNGIKKQFNNENVNLTTEVDPALVDGYEIYYADKYYLDNSERTRIAQLKSAVKSAVDSYTTNVENEIDSQLADALK